MSLTAGTMIGPYRIVSAIGAGGMGEVYRATDTRLGRDVAIKVLPDGFAADPARRARFEREAQALASLNHFNIAQIYGFEDRALVMELLEGETLRERLRTGPLPIRKAVEYAGQIARGLAAAHDRGIIHRDLKPENVFIVTDGHIKILDFGLARRDATAGEVTATLTASPATDPGVVMGTVGYMSPEQVRGLPVDARSDLFSFGAMFYEMVTGQRAFRRDSAPETMSAILNDHPAELSSVRADVSPALDRIVQHCLEKNPVERFQSARDIAFALDSLSGTSTAAVARAKQRAFTTERLVWSIVTLLLLAALAWSVKGEPPSTPVVAAPASRTVILLPDGVAINESTPPVFKLAVSPDGTRVAFQGRLLTSGRPQLFVQPLDGAPALPLPDTETGYAMFWSRDSRYLYYMSRDGLHRLSIDGGGIVSVLAEVPAVFFGAAPVTDDQVLLGGDKVQLWNLKDGSYRTVLEQSGQQYFIPNPLPDARRFLFLQSNGSKILSGRLGSLDSNNTTELVSGEISNIGYASGAVLFARGDTVLAQRVDADPFKLSGDPIPLARSVDASSGRGAAFSVSANGVLVYQAVESRPLFRLTWVDRDGRTIKTVGDDADYSNLELAKDGRHLLTSVTDPRYQTRDIFIVDLDRAIRQRFTADPSDERSAVWSPDGTRVLYTSKNLDFYERNADASGSEKPVLKNSDNKDIYDWSEDGKQLLYRRFNVATANDVWIGPADGSSPGRPILDSTFNELPGKFSPDAKRLVYSSDESGQTEIYVIGVDGHGKTQVSSGGGTLPRWRGDGKEILYLSPQRTLMSVPVGPAPAFELGAARALFPMNATMRPGVYDVTADGQRFIVAAPVPSRLPPSLTVLTNWPQLLESKK